MKKAKEENLKIDLFLTLDQLDTLLKPNNEEEKFIKNIKKLSNIFYSLSIKTKFDNRRGVVYGKYLVDLARKLEADYVRIILDNEEISNMPSYLYGVARYSSFIAGGGKSQKTIKIAYDINQEWTLEKVLYLNRNLNKSFNCAPSIDLSQISLIESKKISRLLNGNEFNIFCLSNLIDNNIESINILSPMVDEDIICNCYNNVEKLDFNIKVDYTKSFYPSSVARYIIDSLDIKLERSSFFAGKYSELIVNIILKENLSKKAKIRLCFAHPYDGDEFEVDKNILIESNKSITIFTQNVDACRYLVLELNQNFSIDDKIKITYKGKIGTVSRKQERIYFQIDEYGYNYYKENLTQGFFEIKNGKAVKLIGVIPSVTDKNDTIKLKIRLEDEYKNPAYEKINEIKIDGIYYKPKILNNRLNTYYVILPPVKSKFKNFEIEALNLKSKTNYTIIAKEKIYFGDIHSHLSYMDGVGKIDEMYEYAKDVAFLDFCCHSEHIDSFSGGRQCTNDIQWEIVKKGARKYNIDNEFVCLEGYENSETWDANIYFKNKMESYRVDGFGDRLLKFVEGQDAIIIPHMTSYPQRQRGYDFNIYSKKVMPVMEIYSCHGANEYFGNEYPLANSEQGGFAFDALKRGYKIGFIGSGDGHSCRPGNTKLLTHGYENGLVGIYTNDLTREGVFNAIKNRKCYATSNRRIIGFFDVDGNKKDFITHNKNKKINYSLFGTTEFDWVEIIINCIVQKHIDLKEDKIVASESIELQSGENSIYIKARQKDGGYIWLSPKYITVK